MISMRIEKCRHLAIAAALGAPATVLQAMLDGEIECCAIGACLTA